MFDRVMEPLVHRLTRLIMKVLKARPGMIIGPVDVTSGTWNGTFVSLGSNCPHCGQYATHTIGFHNHQWAWCGAEDGAHV